MEKYHKVDNKNKRDTIKKIIIDLIEKLINLSILPLYIDKKFDFL